MLALIYWEVSPIAIDLGPFSLRWYSLLFVTGIGLSYLVLRQRFREVGLPEPALERLTVYGVVGMVAGARLGHFLFYEPAAFLQYPLEIILPVSFHPEIHFTGYRGLASHGGVLGVLIGLWVFLRQQPGISGWLVLDQVTLIAPLAGFFIRLGNLFNSEIIGQPTSAPWAFVFSRVDLLPRHPAQLYEAFGYLLVFLVLLSRQGPPRKLPPGTTFSMGLGLVFLIRFGVEFYKIDQVAFESQLTLNMGQLLSIPFLILGVVLWYLRRSAS